MASSYWESFSLLYRPTVVDIVCLGVKKIIQFGILLNFIENN